MAPGYMVLLSTWNVVGVTEELNALLHIRVESLSVPCGWVSTLSASEEPDWGGSCPVSTPGTTAPSGHMAGKRLRFLSQWLRCKESTFQCKRRERRGFDPWVKKIPSRREWQCTPGFLPGESHAQRSLVSYATSWLRNGRTWLNRHSTQPHSLMWQVAPHWISQTEYSSSFYLANLHCFNYCFMESILL